MSRVRNLLPILAGGVGGALAWRIARPYAPTWGSQGTKAGDVMFTVGSTYGWISHAALGALVVGLVALTDPRLRLRSLEAWMRGLAGLALGAALGWGSDYASDLMSLRIMRSGVMGEDPPVTLMWHFAVASSLVLAVALCSHRGGSLVKTAAVAALGSHVVRTVFGTFASIIVEGNGFDDEARFRAWNAQGWEDLFYYVAIGALVGRFATEASASVRRERLEAQAT